MNLRPYTVEIVLLSHCLHVCFRFLSSALCASVCFLFLVTSDAVRKNAWTTCVFYVCRQPVCRSSVTNTGFNAVLGSWVTPNLLQARDSLLTMLFHPRPHRSILLHKVPLCLTASCSTPFWSSASCYILIPSGLKPVEPRVNVLKPHFVFHQTTPWHRLS